MYAVMWKIINKWLLTVFTFIPFYNTLDCFTVRFVSLWRGKPTRAKRNLAISSQGKFAESLPVMSVAIDMRQIRTFARHFKARRLELGLTTKDVADAICPTWGPTYSFEHISQFERLKMSKFCSLKMLSVLKRWLAQVEIDEELPPIPRPNRIKQAKIYLEKCMEQPHYPSSYQLRCIAAKVGRQYGDPRRWFKSQKEATALDPLPSLENEMDNKF